MQAQFEQRVLVLVTLALVAFGLVMVYSATSASAVVDGGDPMQFLIKQGMYAAGGLVLLAFLWRFDYHRLRLIAPVALLASLAACVAVLVVGPSINGAHRWFVLGPISLQPSEFAKLAVCIWVSVYLSRRPVPRTLGELMKPVGIVVVLFGALIVIEPDLGTTIALMLMVSGILLVSGISFRLLALSTTLALGAGLAAIWMEPYRKARVMSFLDPWKDPLGAGFQNVQALIGLGSGGPGGEGLGRSISKLNYLPEAHNDMIFAVAGEELGLFATVFVVGAFMAFAWAGFRVAVSCRDPLGKRLAVGITTLIAGQAAVNLAAVLGVAPLTGITLPFISYGGSSLLMLLGSVGILLNIAGNERVVEARVPDRSRGNSRSRSAGAGRSRSTPRTRRDGDVRRNPRPRRVAAGS